MRGNIYSVKSIFSTVQGEGHHAGTPAVFIRFAVCNVWSGREQDRDRDAAKGMCAAWCDTEFTGGTSMDIESIMAAACAARKTETLAVLTGGEPGLQVDAPLVSALRGAGFYVAMETNGSVVVPGVDWLCVSPKPPMKLAVTWANEVKVVMPGVDPGKFYGLAAHRYVQPRWCDGSADVDMCLRYIRDNPGWRLSCQTHKYLGIP